MPSPSILLSVVIPVYNEGAGVLEVLRAVEPPLRACAPSHEILFVDDGSQDDTWAFIRQACDDRTGVRGIRLTRNFGKEAALWAGLAQARGQAVLVMDGDLQHPPALIPRMIELWQQTGVEVVEAIKMDRGNEKLLHRLGARAFYTLMNRLSGFGLERSSDFKLLDRRAVDQLLRLEERNLFFRGLVAWMGFERLQIPFSVPERAQGRSKWSFPKLAAFFTRSITSFSTLPLQLITLAGLLFLVFALVLGTKVFVQWWMGQAVEGFTTVILLLEIIGSLLMLSLGVIGLYLARIYEEVKRRPRSVIRETLPRSPSLPAASEAAPTDAAGLP
ncbi:MAG: glycosyltransferase [Rhodothermaceae bacterium]|nr:MAG: glycosyltransferase [Rhodothermaceae bacterium]